MGSRYKSIILSLCSSLFAAAFVTPTCGMNDFEASSGLTQTIREVECNRFIQIVEGEKEYKELKLRRLKLGAPR